MKIRKAWPGMDMYDGVVLQGPFKVDSTLYAGQERMAYEVQYPADKTKEDLEEDELRPIICVLDLPTCLSVAKS